MKILQILLVNVVFMMLVAGCQGGNPAAVANQGLMRADTAFSALSAQQGFADAFEHYAGADALLLPDNSAALKGKSTIVQNLQAMSASSTLTWSPQSAEVSGNLGYSWGIYTLTGKNSNGQTIAAYGKYLSIWKLRAGDWRLAMMMVNGSPGPAGG